LKTIKVFMLLSHAKRVLFYALFFFLANSLAHFHSGIQNPDPARKQHSPNCLYAPRLQQTHKRPHNVRHRRSPVLCSFLFPCHTCPNTNEKGGDI
uniref:Uncharacterized protein n=1 Tax=Sinocyclocheilus grahami TaxID=75366 RepID=A0A672QB73_SINGR